MRGRRALITGAGSGIGLAMARLFMELGARVHIGDVDVSALERATAALPGLSSSCADVSDEQAAADMVAEAAAAMDGLDVLVNGAGVSGPTAAVEAVEPEEWRRTLDIDVTGMFLCTRAAVPHLKAAKAGSIVNMSSAAGRFGFPLRSPYAAAKWAVVGFTRSISIELGPFDINVNCLQPGPVAGPRIDRVMAEKAAAQGLSRAELVERRLRSISMGRLVTEEEVAALAAYLCSASGHAISGQAIAIDGDQTATL